LHIFELTDPVGPTGTAQEIDACILTREVERGGHMINAAREKNGLNTLALVFVDMILAEEESANAKSFSNKTSSSYIRKYLDEKFDRNAIWLYKEWAELMLDIKVGSTRKASYWWSAVRDAYCQNWRYYTNLKHLMIM
jgi:hypothetical protein